MNVGVASDDQKRLNLIQGDALYRRDGGKE